MASVPNSPSSRKWVRIAAQQRDKPSATPEPRRRKLFTEEGISEGSEGSEVSEESGMSEKSRKEEEEEELEEFALDDFEQIEKDKESKRKSRGKHEKEICMKTLEICADKDLTSDLKIKEITKLHKARMLYIERSELLGWGVVEFVEKAKQLGLDADDLEMYEAAKSLKEREKKKKYEKRNNYQKRGGNYYRGRGGRGRGGNTPKKE